MVPIHCKVGHGVRINFEKWVNWHGKNEIIPVYLEKHFQFLLESRGEINRDQQGERC